MYAQPGVLDLPFLPNRRRVRVTNNEGAVGAVNIPHI